MSSSPAFSPSILHIWLGNLDSHPSPARYFRRRSFLVHNVYQSAHAWPASTVVMTSNLEHQSSLTWNMPQTKMASTVDKSTTKLLSPEEVNTISHTFDVHRDILLAWLVNAKEQDRKMKIRVAINDFCKSFMTISSANMFLLERQSETSKLDNICDKFEAASKTLQILFHNLISSAIYNTISLVSAFQLREFPTHS